MKNYEIKSAMAELSVKEKIKVNSKRIAFLVPDVFRKLKSGFKKATKAFLEKARAAGEVAIGTAVLGGAAVVNGAVNLGRTIGSGVQGVTQNFTDAIKTAATEAVQERDAYNAEKVAALNAKAEVKDEKIVETKSNENINDNMKNYIIKGYESDIEKLRTKTIKVANAPRRLLISKLFIQKLFANRKKRKAERKAEEMARAEEMLRGMPSVEESAPVVETTVPTPEVAVPTPEVATPEMGVDEAIQRYVELNNQRTAVVDELNAMQEKIEAGKKVVSQYETEMMDLANKYGLTREMVEAKFTR